MKKTTWLAGILSVCVFAACKKAATDSVQTSLTASTTQATVGQTVSVSLSSARTAASWTVNPSAAVIKTYDISTSKVNYFTFSQAGTYRIGVRTRDIEYDSVHSQADEYRTLAKKIENNQMFIVPKPLEIDQLEKMLIEHGLAT